jgi:hypothetical protein
LEPSRSDVGESDDDADVEEEVESDDLVDGQDYCEVCVEEGDSARASRYAFVEIDPPAAATAPAPLIHAAFNSAVPCLCFQILPSAHGVAPLHFGSPEAREAAMSAQPFHVGGATVSLGRIEETTDRFVHEPAWLVEVAVWNFPEEYWDEERIHKLFACIGEVMEIDPFCFPEFDRSCLRFVIALQHPRVLHCVGIHPPSGRGIVLQQTGLTFWPREQQYDAAGDWIPYYGTTPPPPPPPAMGRDPCRHRLWPSG